jgi:hypothetical protein
MQSNSNNMKRPRCVHSYSLHSLDDKPILDDWGKHRTPKSSLNCFRLPFCNFDILKNLRNQQAFLTHDDFCPQCKLMSTTPNDIDDDDYDDGIVRAYNHSIKNNIRELKLPSHIKFNNDDISTAATTAATSDGYVNDSFRTMMTIQSQPRYVSFRSILNEKDLSCAEFSNTIEINHQEKITHECNYCHMVLSESWKYCPTCGIYLNK